MRNYFITTILLFITSLAFSQPQGRIGLPGMVKPKAEKIKKPKIKYEFHEGFALLKTGLKLTGKFKYTEYGNEVPQYVFMEAGSRAKKKVALSMIDHMVLAGAERGIIDRRDSTEFVWIDNFKDLYRKVRRGTIEVFDNSRIVNEDYEFLTDYFLLAGRKDYGYKFIKELRDIELFMVDRPYFMASAKATGRYDTKDVRVSIFLIDLFNDAAPMEILKWKDIIIDLKNGERLRGKGYVQPLDLRNEYTASNNAFVHFYDKGEFKLLTQREIKNFTIDDITYKMGMYQVVNKYFYGHTWQYKGIDYIVSQRIVSNSNYYFKHRSQAAQSLVILKEVAGSYVKPLNETELRLRYIEELKASKSAEGNQ